MGPGIVTVDLHGKNTYQAKVAVDALLRRASRGTYRLRLIHGCHGGTALRDFIRETYSHHPQVQRLAFPLMAGPRNWCCGSFNFWWDKIRTVLGLNRDGCGIDMGIYMC